MDFVEIKARTLKNGNVEIYPDFIVGRSKDIMVRGKQFYAIWDDSCGLWSTDEYEVQRLVDAEIFKKCEEYRTIANSNVIPRTLRDFSTKHWIDFKNFMTKVGDNSHQLDTKITFSNSDVTKKDYISRRLPYALDNGDCPAFKEIIETLYDEEERAKILWAIGAVISGDAKSIQKFLVFYGEAGAGKSTILNIIQWLFEGYYITFDAKSLTTSSNAFSTEQFRSNPLVAIQHDGDLSRIEDNSKLNSIISHEEIVINEKYKSGYSMRLNCFLFMASNKPVKITDAKSGIIRRLIDVAPSGRKIPNKRYEQLMTQVQYELGSIANYCLETYISMGKNFYSTYRPVDMMYKTDPFFNFVEDSYMTFIDQEFISLKQAYSMYKEYCNSSGADYILQQYKFREELKNYFAVFEDEHRTDDGKHLRSVYSGFLANKFEKIVARTMEHKEEGLIFNSNTSIFDEMCKNCKAQYASKKETPIDYWDNVTTELKDIDTSQLHYVKVPESHIVIDFDIKDETGNKSFEKNLEAANKWPPTYAELSKSGAGIHLHYIYTGDPKQLSRVYDKDIEIKVYSGNSSLRRKLSKCNDIPVATISSGLPLKGEKVIDQEVVKNERGLRALIKKNLNKEIHPGTKPSCDFIFKLLEDAYESGMHYDVSDLRPAVLAFAMDSTHQATYCIKLVSKMHFKSEEARSEAINENDKPIVFYDVEVYPNLFLICYKTQGKGNKVTRLYNPTPMQVEELLKMKLAGYNCRRYDNHIMYARMMGYTNEQLFALSQRIISGNTDCFFSEAYNASYVDIYDVVSKKQSLKKYEIELGIHHQEMDWDWTKPIPEELWPKVGEYCDNDVLATEAVFENRYQDFVARQILADISGLSVNDTTRMHTTKIIFQGEKHPDLVYTDLREMFPGYSYDERTGKSSYRGEDPGEGGYVYAEPGIHVLVALLDIASMHPSSIRALNLFGSYTKNFTDILDARIAIKHHDFELAATYLNGAFAKYLTNDEQADSLAQALKIVINSVYGYTTATFENPFKDPRNKDNIVAKRGALFMINLKHEVQARGFTVAHIKTDSIKIPNATQEIIDFVMEYGKQYGYNFEHEATYDRMCLVNDAVYIAKYKGGKHDGEWTATGTQFQVPYVFKTLFSKEPIEFKDLCETKQVTSVLYLDMDEDLPDSTSYEKELEYRHKKGMNYHDPVYMSATDDDLQKMIDDCHNMRFIGKVGLFCPIKPGCGGGNLYREKDGKFYAAVGTKGYRWLESETVQTLGKEHDIDIRYYNELVDEAVETISQYGDFEWFVSNDK